MERGADISSRCFKRLSLSMLDPGSFLYDSAFVLAGLDYIWNIGRVF